MSGFSSQTEDEQFFQTVAYPQLLVSTTKSGTNSRSLKRQKVCQSFQCESKVFYLNLDNATS
jgi:hypothetical protein